MKITKISIQQRNSERVNVFIDGKYSFSLSLTQLVEQKIKNGQEISELELKKLEKISEAGKLKQKIIEWLFIRPRSKLELTNYLRKKTNDNLVIEKLCREMAAKGYQDDYKFAAWWQEQRLAKNKSQRYIKNELRAKGVSSDIIDEVSADFKAADASNIANLIAAKNLKRKYPDERKLIAYLLRQGFSYDSIKQALNR